MTRTFEPTDLQRRILVCAARDKTATTGVIYMDEGPRPEVRAGGVRFPGAAAIEAVNDLKAHLLVTIRGVNTGSSVGQFFLTTLGQEEAEKTLADWRRLAMGLSPVWRRVLSMARRGSNGNRPTEIRAEGRGAIVVGTETISTSAAADTLVAMEQAGLLELWKLSPDEVGGFVLAPKGTTLAELFDSAD